MLNDELKKQNLTYKRIKKNSNYKPKKKLEPAQINLCQTCKSSYEIEKENEENHETQCKKKPMLKYETKRKISKKNDANTWLKAQNIKKKINS